MLELKKPRLDFGILFNEFISSYREPVYGGLYGCGDFDYDDYWDDTDYLSYLRGEYNFGSCINSNRHNHSNYPSMYGSQYNKQTRRCGVKKSKRSKKKHILSEPLYHNDDYNVDGYSPIVNNCTVYFYNDINNPDDYELFDNLYRFDEYLSTNGIHINEYEVQKILNRDISHCCSVTKDGVCQCISDHSYSSLYFECCDVVNSNDEFWD